MDSSEEDARLQNTLPDDTLAEEVTPEDLILPIMAFYRRPAWRKTFVIGLVVALWFVIGLVFSPAYFRF